MDIKAYVDDLVRIASQRDSDSEEAAELFQKRLLSMMRDYNISLGEALMWDYEGFENDIKQQFMEGTLEHDFDYYLWVNNVYGTNVGFQVSEIFFGRSTDLVIKGHRPKSHHKS